MSMVARRPRSLRTSRTMLSSLDIVPLAVGVAGGALPVDRVFDGRDPLPSAAAGSFHAVSRP